MSAFLFAYFKLCLLAEWANIHFPFHISLISLTFSFLSTFCRRVIILLGSGLFWVGIRGVDKSIRLWKLSVAREFSRNQKFSLSHISHSYGNFEWEIVLHKRHNFSFNWWGYESLRKCDILGFITIKYLIHFFSFTESLRKSRLASYELIECSNFWHTNPEINVLC